MSFEILEAVAGARVGASGWARGNCPLCVRRQGTPDTRRCLGVHVESGRWHCFRCAAGGSLRQQDRDDLDDLLEDAAEEHEQAALAGVELPESFTPLFEQPGWGSLLHRRALLYARSRVSDIVGLEAGIGACLTGPARNRVVIPIHRLDGVVAGWTARDYTDRSAIKYLTPAGWDRCLFNPRPLHTPSAEPAFLVEGGWDALALWPDASAFLGKPTPRQIADVVSAVQRSRRPVVVALDGDAWREAEALALQLHVRGLPEVTWVRLPPKRDPGKLGDAVRAAASTAINNWRIELESQS